MLCNPRNPAGRIWTESEPCRVAAIGLSGTWSSW